MRSAGWRSIADFLARGDRRAARDAATGSGAAGWRRRLMLGFAAAGLLVASATGRAADPPGWPALRDGTILLLRHAEAPGIGDPPGFRLGDCSSQRNLNDAGRAQARRIGEAVRGHTGVRVGAVIASEWCRTHETADLAFPGRVRDDARFNSFFDGDSAQEARQTDAARQFLREWRGPGVLVVVTHQVNITALTGVYPSAGEGVVVVPAGTGLTTVGRIRF